MSRSNKAMALFGMQSKSTIEGIVRNGLAHWMEFVIPIADYHMFWDDMAKTENATMFATKLLQRLVEIVENPSKANLRLASLSKVTAPEEVETLHQLYVVAICHSLHFLKICFSIDRTNRDFHAALGTLLKPQYVSVSCKGREDRDGGGGGVGR